VHLSQQQYFSSTNLSVLLYLCVSRLRLIVLPIQRIHVSYTEPGMSPSVDSGVSPALVPHLSTFSVPLGNTLEHPSLLLLAIAVMVKVLLLFAIHHLSMMSVVKSLLPLPLLLSKSKKI
jgi:hypothetical protein